MSLDFGQTVTGVVLVNDGQHTRIARPRREVTGTVVGLLPFQSNVAIVALPDSEEDVYVRVSR